MDQPLQGLDEVRIRARDWEKSLRREAGGLEGGGPRPCVPLTHPAVQEAYQGLKTQLSPVTAQPQCPRWAHLSPPRPQENLAIPKAVCGPHLIFQAPVNQGSADHPHFTEEEIEAMRGEVRLHQTKLTWTQPLPPTCCVTLTDQGVSEPPR